MTSIVLVVVSIALIIMSVVFAVTAHALFVERRKNSELNEKLRNLFPRVEVKRLAESSPGTTAEYDIIVDGKVIKTISLP